MRVLTLSQAYARQSTADLDAYDALIDAVSVAECERLHFIQMACEKLVKAHLCASGSDPDDLRTSHAYIGKNLSTVLRCRVARLSETDRTSSRWLLDWLRPVAREIELLAPAVTDDGRRPDNCEYPWTESDGAVRYPAAYSFPNLGLIRSRQGVVFLELLRAAAEELS